MRTWVKNLLWLVAFSLLVETAIYALIVARGEIPLANIVPRFLQGVAIAFSIGSLSWWWAKAVAHAVWRFPPAVRWLLIALTMLGTGAAGTALGVGVLHFGFGVAANVPFWRLTANVSRSTVPFTILVGIVITLLESRREKIRVTELELKAQQLQRERAEKLAAEAQFASLSSRVQPHFLFNALNSISALIREDPARAELMIERLSSLLRSSLDPARTVPLAQEWKLVSDYLELQQVRFGDRLRYRVDPVGDGLAAASVPPFAVQTLVENALKHVAGGRLEGVDVRVEARKSQAGVEIDVTDDGPGFGPGAIATGHGLDNLQERLRSLFGERAGIELLPAHTGMTVRMRVPA